MGGHTQDRSDRCLDSRYHMLNVEINGKALACPTEIGVRRKSYYVIRYARGSTNTPVLYSLL